MSKLKILFLDVDGVLNNRNNLMSRDDLVRFAFDKDIIEYYDPSASVLGFDIKCVNNLFWIIKETSCKIVLSSSWRKIPRLVRVIKNLDAGSEYELDLIGVTPGSCDGKRGGEIKEYLENSGFSDYVYAIVDDDSDMLEEQMPHFFKTTNEFGLTKNIAQNIINHLNRE